MYGYLRKKARYGAILLLCMLINGALEINKDVKYTKGAEYAVFIGDVKIGMYNLKNRDKIKSVLFSRNLFSYRAT